VNPPHLQVAPPSVRCKVRDRIPWPPLLLHELGEGLARLDDSRSERAELPSLPSSCETASAVGLLSLRARTDVLSCRSSLQGWIPSRGWMPPVEERREP
jgi:hypothetical protein